MDRRCDRRVGQQSNSVFWLALPAAVEQTEAAAVGVSDADRRLQADHEDADVATIMCDLRHVWRLRRLYFGHDFAEKVAEKAKPGEMGGRETPVCEKKIKEPRVCRPRAAANYRPVF